MRKANAMDMFTVNIGDAQNFAKARTEGKNKLLEDEQRWLDKIKEAQVKEANYHTEQRKMRIADLRQEYRDQAEQKRDCERNFIKFS